MQISWLLAGPLLIAIGAHSTQHAPVVTALDLPLDQFVGPVRAGSLCLPHGRMRVADFFRSARDLQSMVDEATEEATYPHGRYSAIRLTALDVRLCAKSWGILGLGDRQRLSGESRFTFISERPEGSKAERVIVLELTGKQALRPDEIAREAIRRLILTDDPV